MVPKSGMVLPTLKQPNTNVTFTALRHSVSPKNFFVLKFPCLQIWNSFANIKTTINQCCIYSIKTFRVTKKFLCHQILVSPNLKWSCQRCTSVVVPVYGMLPRGGGWGNVWLKNNVVPTLGQHWDFASIDNHYTTIIPRVPKHPLLLLVPPSRFLAKMFIFVLVPRTLIMSKVQQKIKIIFDHSFHRLFW